MPDFVGIYHAMHHAMQVPDYGVDPDQGQQVHQGPGIGPGICIGEQDNPGDVVRGPNPAVRPDQVRQFVGVHGFRGCLMYRYGGTV